MTVDTEKFIKLTCSKCKRYTKDKLKFGMCEASRPKIYECANMRLFNLEEFERWTGIEFFKRF